MRAEATKVIYEAALHNRNIIFITGDLGHPFAKDYKTNIPDQYINTGLAEQNMVGLAAGLALSGKKVFTFSITPFALMRCFEQIRVDICYQNLDVTVIGIGAGFAYSTSGCTHYGTEDIAIMRTLPNMKIFSPCHPLESRFLAEKLIKTGGPSYFRLGKGNEPTIIQLAEERPESVLSGKCIVVVPGKDISIFATGSIIAEAILAAEELAKINISLEVVNIHTLKPFDENSVIQRLQTKRAIFTLEEHNIIGGLGSTVSEIISESHYPQKPLFKRFGVNDRFTHIVGTSKTLREDHGIDSDSIVKEIKSIVL